MLHDDLPITFLGCYFPKAAAQPQIQHVGDDPSFTALPLCFGQFAFSVYKIW